MNTAELRLAPSGEGPHAYDWSDKPHRVLYDACRLAEQRQATIDALVAALGRLTRVARVELATTRPDVIEQADAALALAHE